MRKQALFYRYGLVGLLLIALCAILALRGKEISRRYYTHQFNEEVKAIMGQAGLNAEKIDGNTYGKSIAMSAFAEALYWTKNARTPQTFHKARQLADQIKDPYYKLDALKTLAQAQFDVSATPGSHQLLRQATIIADKIPPTAPKNWVSRRDYELQKIGIAQAKFGFLDDSLKTVSLIHNCRSKSIVLSIIAEKQVEARNFTASIQTIWDGDSHDKAIVLSEVAEAQIKDGKNADANQTIADAVHAAGLITRTSATKTAWSAIALAQSQAGDINGALMTANKTGTSYTRYTTLRAIVEAQTNAGDTAGAHRTADMITDSPVKCGALQAIAEAELKSGNTMAAQQTAQEAQKTAEQKPDSSARCLSLYLMAEAQITSKNLAAARSTLQQETKVADTITDNDISAFYLSEIATSQIEANDFVNARATIDKCGADITKVRTLSHIAAMQMKAGDKSAARATLEDASETIDASISSSKDSDIDVLGEYSHIITQQKQVGDFSGASRLLHHLHQAADKTPDFAGKSVALSNIVSGLYANQ